MANELVHSGKPIAIAEQAARVDELLALWRMDLETADPQAVQEARDSAGAAVASGLVQAVGRAMLTPAAGRAIAMAVAELIASFPQDKKNDLQTYSRLLVEDVAAINASPLVLQAAFRAIRQSKDFLPSIAEVVSAVEAEKAACAARAALLARLARRIGEADRRLAQAVGGAL